MERYELLVHVSAPARIRDDKKYLFIAQSIIDFDAAAVTRIVPETEQLMDRVDQEFAHHIEHEQSHNNIYNTLRLRTLQGDQPKLQNRASVSPANWQRTKPKSRLLPERKSSFDYNPPYKNPYHGAAAKTPTFGLQTPCQDQRPKTAPDQLHQTVQVPFTGFRKRRSNSESASFGSLSSWISDSQKAAPEPPFGSQPHPKSTIEESFIQDSMAGEKSLIRSLSQASLEELPSPKRARLSEEQESAGILQQRPDGVEAYFMRDRSLDWTSSPTASGESRTDSVPSTASLSQVLATPGRSLPASGSQRRLSQHVDLTFSSPLRDATSPEAPRPDEVNKESPVPMHSRPPSSVSSMQDTCRLAGMDARIEVKFGDPATGQTKFSSHITKPLAELVKRLPFESWFRPIEVKRDVGVLERGYWTMEVTLTDAEAVRAARRSPSKEQQLQGFRNRFAGETHEIRMARYEAASQAGVLHDFDYGFEDKAAGLLTEKEFLDFWRNMSRFIEDGKAGWGVRMVRDGLDLGYSEDGRKKVRVRIFSWGEILGHLYLAFWVLSDKVMGRIPMEWVGGDGATVVKMAGTRAGRGKLGKWSRKGSEGEGGRWGAAER